MKNVFFGVAFDKNLDYTYTVLRTVSETPEGT